MIRFSKGGVSDVIQEGKLMFLRKIPEAEFQQLFSFAVKTQRRSKNSL